MVALLAGGVPDLEGEGGVVDEELLEGEIGADGGFEGGRELVGGELGEQGGFADRGVAQQEHFEEVFWFHGIILLKVGRVNKIKLEGIIIGYYCGLVIMK